MHVPAWKLGQELLWPVWLNCPVWGLYSVPSPVSWRRFWAIYGLRTSGTKSLPLPGRAPAAHPLPAMSHMCPAVTSRLPPLAAPKTPQHFSTRGGLCVPAPLSTTAISPGMSYPRERGEILGRMFTVLISALQGITRLT